MNTRKNELKGRIGEEKKKEKKNQKRVRAEAFRKREKKNSSGNKVDEGKAKQDVDKHQGE